jgi:hypothetical protein
LEFTGSVHVKTREGLEDAELGVQGVDVGGPGGDGETGWPECVITFEVDDVGDVSGVLRVGG